MSDTRIKQARGLTVVSEIIQIGMKSGWQEFNQINDDGIDGILIERKKSLNTGTVYYVQVKCGDSYLKQTKRRSGFLEISLGEKYLKPHRQKWNKIKDPVILVYVDFSSKKAWWTDLKSNDSYCPDENKGLVLIPKSQRFGEHSLSELRKLLSFYDYDRTIDVIQLARFENIQDTFTKPSKVVAKAFYNDWALSDIYERQNRILGEVAISRVGWRHLCLNKRKKLNIIQSYKLVGAAKRIILENTSPIVLKSSTHIEDGVRTVFEDIGLRSRIIFSNRQESLVQVILRRKQKIDLRDGEVLYLKTWFYSVHELRRGKKMC